MKKFYQIISVIIIIAFLSKILSPVIYAAEIGGIEDIETSFESEIVMPDIGYKFKQGPGLFDPIPARYSVIGGCLMNLITEKDLRFVQDFINEINEALRLLRLLNLDIAAIIIFPVFMLDIMALVHFWLTKVVLIIIFAINAQGIFQNFLNGRIQCLADGKIMPPNG